MPGVATVASSTQTGTVQLRDVDDRTLGTLPPSQADPGGVIGVDSSLAEIPWCDALAGAMLVLPGWDLAEGVARPLRGLVGKTAATAALS